MNESSVRSCRSNSVLQKCCESGDKGYSFVFTFQCCPVLKGLEFYFVFNYACLPLPIPKFSCTTSLLSPFHLYTPHAPFVLLLSTAHVCDCCATFHVHSSDAYDRSGRIMLFFTPFLLPWSHFSFVTQAHLLHVCPTILSLHALILKQNSP